MTIRIPSILSSGLSEVYTIDFRETAPSLSNSSMFANDPLSSRYGGLSVGVPGEVRGLEEAHRRWGKLPWKRLLEPSIVLARGWEVDRELGKRITVCEDKYRFVSDINFAIEVVSFLDVGKSRLARDIRPQRDFSPRRRDYPTDKSVAHTCDYRRWRLRSVLQCEKASVFALYI